ncbi:GNAT family N-acetyltransferase [Streptomyces qinzhouensis]|uniref:GNAT family N-acetyltransferase n=1 Tax=Streptomyces qinzhouensis TaxID=2599401 RepID=A0A5B8IU93_9ACTN|nr:GNAT family N-acetyltransferase [Streptomyces qinzhouensis]
MTSDDLPSVTADHLRYFPDGFFARLGPGFLTAYLRTYLDSPHALAYAAPAPAGPGERPAGYLLGVLDPAAHRAHLLHFHRRGLAARGALALAVRPQAAAHFLRTRTARYARALLPAGPPAPAPAPDRAPESPPPPAGRTAVLAYVAVTDDARSLGLGGALIDRFTADATAAGCDRAELVTLAGTGGAGPYYERRGWTPRGTSAAPDGRPLTTYQLLLAGPAATGGPLPDDDPGHRGAISER